MIHAVKRLSLLIACIRKVFLLVAIFLSGDRALLAQRTTFPVQEFPATRQREGPQVEKELLPPPPAGMILDSAHVLLPEALARLSSKLVSARTEKVAVYVVTVSTLNVPSSKQAERLDQLATEYAEGWLASTVGAVIIFDDQGGLMTVQLSPETNNRFPSFAIELELKGSLSKAQESGLAREKLERSANIVAETLGRHQADTAKVGRRNFIGNFIMSVVAIIGLGLAIMSSMSGPKSSTK